MKYSSQNLAKAVLRLVKENPNEYKKTINGFVEFCQKKHLMHLMPSFLKYLKLEDKIIQEAETLKIYSAGKLDENIVKKIKELSGAETHNLTEIIEDKDIVAGFIAYYKNKIIDASLANSLRLFKNKLINN